MSTESIEVSGVVHAPADRIYQAWLSSSEHTAMTGSRATVEPNVGGRFTAYDGRIEGATVELEPGRRIVQRWRSSDFPSDAADSLLEVRLEPLDIGTRVAFVHSEIPEGQATQLEEGWRKYYLEPMDKYFASGWTPSRFDEEMGRPPMETAVEEEARPAEPTPKPAAKKPAPAKAAAAKAAPVAAKKAAPKPAAKAKPKRTAKKAAPRKAAKKAKAARRSARKGGAKKAARKGKAKRSARRGKR